MRRLSDRELFREGLARRLLLRFQMTLILVATAAAGLVVQRLCPAATKLSEALQLCVG